MWGDWLLVNVQWALFRYQQSYLGNSLILGHKDVLYIYLGQNTGLFNITAAALWATGAMILLIGLCITMLTYVEEKSSLLRTASLFTLGGGILLCISAILRFHDGFAIPIGVPLILIVGWWMYKENRDDNNDEKTFPETDSEEPSVQEQ
jgi:hypothetical protein